MTFEELIAMRIGKEASWAEAQNKSYNLDDDSVKINLSKYGAYIAKDSQIELKVTVPYGTADSWIIGADDCTDVFDIDIKWETSQTNVTKTNENEQKNVENLEISQQETQVSSSKKS